VKKACVTEIEMMQKSMKSVVDGIIFKQKEIALKQKLEKEQEVQQWVNVLNSDFKVGTDEVHKSKYLQQQIADLEKMYKERLNETEKTMKEAQRKVGDLENTSATVLEKNHSLSKANDELERSINQYWLDMDALRVQA